MKKQLIFLLCFFQVMNLFCKDLTFENFVIKQNTSDWKKDTFYLGQLKTQSELDELIKNYKYDKIGDYDGFKSVVKVYDENIELFFSKSEIFKLIEIRIKSDKYILYGTSIKIGNSLENAIKDYYNCFENYNNEGEYYFAELADFTNEFDGVAFFNISLFCKQGVIDNIILYYSFTL